MLSLACGTSVRLRVVEVLFLRFGSLLVEPVVCLRLSPLGVRMLPSGELPLWKGLSSLKTLSAIGGLLGSSFSSSSVLTCGVSLFLDFRTVFLTLPPSGPVSVSEALACLLLARGVFFIGLLAVDVSDSLSSCLTFDGVFLDRGRGVGGGGINSPSRVPS